MSELEAGLVAAVVSQLQGALPELLATANLPAPAAVLNYDPPLLDPTQSPRVWVDLTQDRRSTSAARGATVQKYSHELTVVVGIQVAGSDPEKTVNLLRSYCSVTRQALEAEPTLGGLALWCRWMTTRFSPNLSKTAATLQKEAILSFDLNYRSTYRVD